MARKPAHLELVGGKGPRQRIWDAIRAWHRKHGADGEAFDRLDVMPGDVADDTARDYLRALERAGHIVKVRAARQNVRQTWRLAVDAGIEAPRLRPDGTPVTQGRAQEQMWRTLRMQKGDINARELAACASTQTVPVNAAAASDYLRNLGNAGYLQTTAEGRAGGRNAALARYRLRAEANTGPRPPMVCRTDCVYDPNLGRVVWQAGVTDEDAIYARR